MPRGSFAGRRRPRRRRPMPLRRCPARCGRCASGPGRTMHRRCRLSRRCRRGRPRRPCRHRSAPRCSTGCGPQTRRRRRTAHAIRSPVTQPPVDTFATSQRRRAARNRRNLRSQAAASPAETAASIVAWLTAAVPHSTKSPGADAPGLFRCWSLPAGRAGRPSGSGRVCVWFLAGGLDAGRHADADLGGTVEVLIDPVSRGCDAGCAGHGGVGGVEVPMAGSAGLTAFRSAKIVRPPPAAVLSAPVAAVCTRVLPFATVSAADGRVRTLTAASTSSSRFGLRTSFTKASKFTSTANWVRPVSAETASTLRGAGEPAVTTPSVSQLRLEPMA